MSGAGFSVEGVMEALAAQPVKSAGGGRAIMVVAARRREGVTTAAAQIAMAPGARATYAFDLDLKRNGLARALSSVDTLGPRIDGRLNGVSFYSLRSAANTPLHEATPAFGFHRVGRARTYVGVFDSRGLPTGARVAVSASDDYWRAARAGGANIVVDAPSLDRGSLALRVAQHMDGVVMVVGADRGAAPAAIAAKAALEDAGANVIGLIYAGATAPVMAIERVMRQIG
jgi:hypothetical protein